LVDRAAELGPDKRDELVQALAVTDEDHDETVEES
jgi:hypothetical protein